MKYQFAPKGVCSTLFHADVSEGGIVEKLTVENGCNGYGNGVSQLVQGMHIDDIIERFDGVRCGRKKTSCPDQMAKMFMEIKKELQESQ
ncbi:MAG: TIGR03905 family TSCPD domain-containing protein [Peptococcaceae bacterium]|jgi:uncharacterized protein (TIGR03905 family)|nr:TIGR03905 family TSCPD domain-containing protein [Peptococcaceae bacterium]